MSETISRPKCVQAPAPAIVVEDQIDRVLEQVAAPVDLPAFATPTQIGRRLAVIRDTLDKLEKTEGCMGASFNRCSKERDTLVDLIFTMQPGNLHDVAAILSATIDPLGMLEGFNLTRKEIDKYTTQLQHAVCGSLKHLMAHGINVDALAPVDTAYEVQRILGTPAEATPSALRDLADTMERQFVEIGNIPDDEWPIDHGPQVLMDYWANVAATQKQTVQSTEDMVNLARITRTLENSVAKGDECPALENIHRMLVSAILDGHMPSPAGRDASIIAKATAATAFGRHVDDAADHFPNDEAGDEALARLVSKRADMMDDLIRCKPTSLQGFAAMAQAIVESDPGVKEGGEPISDSRHLAAFARHLAAVAPQSGVSPDVALINDCNRFCAIEARSNKLWSEAKTQQEDDAATFACAPFEDESRALMERITTLKAHTPAGNTARARALSIFAPDLLEPSERLDCAQNMLAALARDTLAMGASA